MSEISRYIVEAGKIQRLQEPPMDRDKTASGHNYVFYAYSYRSVKNSAKAFAAVVLAFVAMCIAIGMCNQIR